MKFSVFLWLVSIINVLALDTYSQNTELSLSLKSASIEKVLLEIEKKSEFYFLYNSKLIDVTRKVDANYSNQRIVDILDQLFADKNVEYIVKDRQIILSPNSYEMLYGDGEQDGQLIKGIVTDFDNNPLPGVNIVEKGTANGTVTDIDGNYQINVTDENAVLIFSFIGYLSEEVMAGTNSQLDLVLIEDITKLDEVVVVGYGTVKKSDITGSLSSVTAEQIKEMPIQNANQAIQGKAAGVDVYNTNFRPGEAPSIRVRGNRSIKANNDPLYVIDGIATVYGINEINPQDIQSIEILKDASASAIYGSRAANGVILITTKRGTKDKVTVNYEGSFSFENPLREKELFDGGEWADMRREAGRAAGSYQKGYINLADDRNFFLNAMNQQSWESIKMGYEWEDYENDIPVMRPTTPEEKERWGVDEVPAYNPENVRTYDWMQHAINENALNQNHQFNVSGGTENLSIMFSAGYLNQEGVVKTWGYERGNTRLNMDFKVKDWFKVGVSNSYSLSIQDYGTDMYAKAVDQIPITVPYDTAGNFIQYPPGYDRIKNPVRDPGNILDKRRVTRYFGSYYAEIELFEGLKYRINAGQDVKYQRRGQYQDKLSSERDGDSDMAEYLQENWSAWLVENLLYYNKEIGDHAFGLTLLQSASVDRHEKSRIRVTNLPFESQLWYNVGTTREGNPESFESSFSKTQLLSYMARLNYGLMDKYLLTATIRRDGSSVFYENNKWDIFPSFAFAWKAGNEPFIKNISAISQMKVRVGYGTTGNSAVRPYESTGRIEQTIYDFDGQAARGFVNYRAETKDVGWEKTASLNGGIDFGLYKNRVYGNIDIYRAQTYDLLLDRTIPSINGYEVMRANIGEVENKGFEIALNTVNISTSNFSWETSLTFATNKEQILKLYGDDQDDLGNRWFIGEPTRVFYDYKFDGIWQEEDMEKMEYYNAHGNSFKIGDIRPANTNGDTIINEEDHVIVGTPNPDWTGGITNRFRYKGVELSFFVYARIGQGVYNRSLVPTLSGTFADRKVNYWTPTNPSNEYPQPDQFLQFPFPQGALYYADASFVKVRNITLSYDFPASLLSKVNINNLNVYVQAVNPFIFTDYPLLDPEVQGTKTRDDQHENYLDPTSQLNGFSTRSLVFGIRVGL